MRRVKESYRGDKKLKRGIENCRGIGRGIVTERIDSYRGEWELRRGKKFTERMRIYRKDRDLVSG